MNNLNELASTLGELNVVDALALVKKLEDTWGVSATAPVIVAPEIVTLEVVEEQTEFDVILKKTGLKKIDVIKTIRQLISVGLKDAKVMSETEDAKIMEAVGEEVAEDAKARLEAAGAVIEIV